MWLIIMGTQWDHFVCDIAESCVGCFIVFYEDLFICLNTKLINTVDVGVT